MLNAQLIQYKNPQKVDSVEDNLIEAKDVKTDYELEDLYSTESNEIENTTFKIYPVYVPTTSPKSTESIQIYDFPKNHKMEETKETKGRNFLYSTESVLTSTEGISIPTTVKIDTTTNGLMKDTTFDTPSATETPSMESDVEIFSDNTTFKKEISQKIQSSQTTMPTTENPIISTSEPDLDSTTAFTTTNQPMNSTVRISRITSTTSTPTTTEKLISTTKTSSRPRETSTTSIPTTTKKLVSTTTTSSRPRETSTEKALSLRTTTIKYSTVSGEITQSLKDLENILVEREKEINSTTEMTATTDTSSTTKRPKPTRTTPKQRVTTQKTRTSTHSDAEDVAFLVIRVLKVASYRDYVMILKVTDIDQKFKIDVFLCCSSLKS